MKIALIGATAYTSYELIRVLLRHPEAEIVHLGGRREGEPAISEVFPALEGLCEMRLGGMEPQDVHEEPEVVFLALPHGISQQYVPMYLEAGARCIDFSADYRFEDLSEYESWYGKHTDPDNLAGAVYGLPELFREQVRNAVLVANPGCYPTAAVLALAPFVRDSLVDVSDVIVDAKSGVSGRGNKPDPGSMFCECNENTCAYKVGAHRHEPEIGRALRLLGATGENVFFTPHLVPMDRGILCTIYVQLLGDVSGEELQSVLEAFYEGEPFIRVKPAGKQPRTKDVAFTNYCDIAVTRLKGRRAVLTAAIDNLLKGASSQAVQNMNVMFGLDETAGLL